MKRIGSKKVTACIASGDNNKVITGLKCEDIWVYINFYSALIGNNGDLDNFVSISSDKDTKFFSIYDISESFYNIIN